MHHAELIAKVTIRLKRQLDAAADAVQAGDWRTATQLLASAHITAREIRNELAESDQP